MKDCITARDILRLIKLRALRLGKQCGKTNSMMTAARFIKNTAISLAAVAMITAVSCKRNATPLIIKTGVSPLNLVVDDDTPDAYTFLKKAAADFVSQYKGNRLAVSLSQYEVARRGDEIDGCLDTEYSPDVLFASQFNLSAYAHDGVLVPLDDIIDDGIKADLFPGSLDNCAIGGKTYMLPYLTQTNVLCFNKALFRQSGLDRYCDTDEVQSWTLEEWDAILAALKSALPDTSYPMMMYAADEQGDTHIMTLLRSHGSPFFDATGHVCLTTSEGLSALSWLRQYNEKGYFPPHPERLVILDNYELFAAGQLALYLCNHTLQTYFDELGIECGYVNFPSIDGAGYTTSFDMSFAVVDARDDRRLKVAKAFVTYIYKSRYLDYSAGGIPVSKRVATQYADALSDVSRYLNNTACNVNFSGNNPNWIGVRAAFYPHIKDLFATNKSIEQIAQEIEQDCNDAIDKGHSRPHE